MVKRILSIALLITLLLSFSACTRPAEDVGGADAPKVSQTAGESETTTEPTTTPTTTTPTTPSGSAYPRVDGKLTNAEKAAFNKELNFTFYRPFTQMIPDGVETLVFDTDLFATAEGRIRYAWQSAIGEETVSYIDELRADGEGETGALAMKEADFVAFYERLFGKKADMTVLARVHPEFTLRDGYIYGYHITGWGLPSFVLKAVSFKDTGTDRCVLTMDLLTSFTVVTSNGKTYADVDEEFILEYASETVLTYPAEAVYARVTLNLLASEEGYVLQNLHVTQERAANTTTTTTATTTTKEPTTTPTTTNPSESVIEGYYGDGITATFDAATGVLTVSGEGVVDNLYPLHQNDFEEYDNGTVKKVVIGEGITHVRNCFNHLLMLESIQFPSTLHTIEESFIECGNIYYGDGRYVDVTIPATVKKILRLSFRSTGFENLIFEGPVEIGAGAFEFAHFRQDKKLVISSGSVLCGAFDYTFGLREIVLEPGVVFCDHKNAHSYQTDSNCFGCLYEQARVYAYAPVYEGKEPATAESLSRHFWNVYLPIIIPEGESIENYRNTHKYNEDHVDTGFYVAEISATEHAKEFEERLPRN